MIIDYCILFTIFVFPVVQSVCIMGIESYKCSQRSANTDANRPKCGLFGWKRCRRTRVSLKEVCYDHIGCFSNEAPYDNAKGKLPETPEHIQTQFLLFTRQNPRQEFLLNPYDLSTIKASHFNGSRPTVIITHGYMSNGRKPWIQSMTQELLKKDNLNVIAVNWEKGADNLLNYKQAAANTRVVGATIGELVKVLHSSAHASYDQFHLVGHSLGSHISGYAGAYLDGAIGKITGLDPAGLLFRRAHPKTRLDSSDAHYVEVIHTDGDHLGFGLAIGHADFYPNGGDKQPGCVACSHKRVLDLFTESINSMCHFRGYPCQTKKDFFRRNCTRCGLGCADMGYNGQTKRHGKYYFSTNSAAPFCK